MLSGGDITYRKKYKFKAELACTVLSTETINVTVDILTNYGYLIRMGLVLLKVPENKKIILISPS
jgi:hypothetical protein